jgi:hypothetical protein
MKKNKNNSEDSLIILDGLDKAILGIAYQYDKEASIAYDINKILHILMDRDGMTREEGIEYYEFNIIGGYFGESNPCYLDLKSYKEILGDN